MFFILLHHVRVPAPQDLVGFMIYLLEKLQTFRNTYIRSSCEFVAYFCSCVFARYGISVFRSIHVNQKNMIFMFPIFFIHTPHRCRMIRGWKCKRRGPHTFSHPLFESHRHRSIAAGQPWIDFDPFDRSCGAGMFRISRACTLPMLCRISGSMLHIYLPLFS